MTPAWITVADAATETRKSERQIQRWAKAGLVRSRRVGARVLEINRASLLARLADPPKQGRRPKEATR